MRHAALWVRDAYYNVISVLGVRVAVWCEMRIFLDWCESLCPQKGEYLGKCDYLGYSRIILNCPSRTINFENLFFISEKSCQTLQSNRLENKKSYIILLR